METAAASNKNLMSSLKKIKGIYKKDPVPEHGSGSGTHPDGGSETPVEVQAENVVPVDVDDYDIPIRDRKRHMRGDAESGHMVEIIVPTPTSLKGKGKEKEDVCC